MSISINKYTLEKIMDDWDNQNIYTKLYARNYLYEVWRYNFWDYESHCANNAIHNMKKLLQEKYPNKIIELCQHCGTVDFFNFSPLEKGWIKNENHLNSLWLCPGKKCQGDPLSVKWFQSAYKECQTME